MKDVERQPMTSPASIESLFRSLEIIKMLKPKERYWFAVSGSWRTTSPEIERAVRESVQEVLERGGGIVTGGALNVDSIATDEALRIDPSAQSIKVFLPVTIDRYAAHYRKRAEEGVITSEQAEALIEQLTTLRETNPSALIEHPENTEVNERTYFERNTAVINASDALLAFHVNQSSGLADTVHKAMENNKPVRILEYTIDSNDTETRP